MQFVLMGYEVETLIEHHRDQQRICADKEEYMDAEHHKKRAEELREQLLRQ